MIDSSAMSNCDSLSPYELIFRALLIIPISHYLIGFTIFVAAILYNFLEWHVIRDILTGFRGQSVTLYYNSESKLYDGVVSKCRILHGRYKFWHIWLCDLMNSWYFLLNWSFVFCRYLATPWLASPHIQTTFLNFFGRPPVFNYRRWIFFLLFCIGFCFVGVLNTNWLSFVKVHCLGWLRYMLGIWFSKWLKCFCDIKMIRDMILVSQCIFVMLWLWWYVSHTRS